ncbi:hypothetical protein [Gordonia sp. (in: high G+C Gram-positive bacteria)]|uniref:hypothetical protein n=1 Tax=Gordonia sp. (in: high G+C Gram-positive bacteria) TaxID=84139 RepID=UPI0039E4D2A6
MKKALIVGALAAATIGIAPSANATTPKPGGTCTKAELSQFRQTGAGPVVCQGVRGQAPYTWQGVASVDPVKRAPGSPCTGSPYGVAVSPAGKAMTCAGSMGWR